MAKKNKIYILVVLVIIVILIFIFPLIRKDNLNKRLSGKIIQQLNRIETRLKKIETITSDYEKNKETFTRLGSKQNNLLHTKIKKLIPGEERALMQTNKLTPDEVRSLIRTNAIDLNSLGDNYRNLVGAWKQQDNCDGRCQEISILSISKYKGKFYGVCEMNDDDCSYSASKKLITTKFADDPEEIQLMITKYQKDLLVICSFDNDGSNQMTELHRQKE